MTHGPAVRAWLGPVLAARVLAAIGDDPARFTSPSGLRAFAGTAPVTRASGRSHYVKARKIRNKRLGDTRHWWAFATLTRSPGARAHYRGRRPSPAPNLTRGKAHSRDIGTRPLAR
ncbi:transposase [Nocardioides terrisoli]|uniref:transposase n=1 Tax=Nocardioides terrisoli TaxID=3388267 RepID=UPI0037C88C8C